MDFIEKKNAHDRLLGVTHLEADRELLKQKAPQHNLLKRGIFNRLQDASSILFALLDLATEEEIVRHRRTLAAVKERAAAEDARLKAEAEEAARLKAEEEARLKAEEEEAARLKAEEEARLKAEEEAQLKAEAEEEARLKAEEEEAEEAARIKAEKEEQAKAPEAATASAPSEKKSSSKSKSTPRSAGDA